MKLKNIGFTFDENINWTRQINLTISQAYDKLKLVFTFKRFLNESSKLNLIEIYILSLKLTMLRLFYKF